jgi:hypothetical protein
LLPSKIIISIEICLVITRLLIAVLIRHHGLSQQVQVFVNNGLTSQSSSLANPAADMGFAGGRGLLRTLAEICRLIHQARKMLIKVLTCFKFFTIIT